MTCKKKTPKAMTNIPMPFIGQHALFHKLYFQPNTPQTNSKRNNVKLPPLFPHTGKSY